jgi:hypothetical protein
MINIFRDTYASIISHVIKGSNIYLEMVFSFFGVNR